ncbi:hypothetical protein [Streptomyces sp. G1]|uniref:hypothetical protein n=1 Tax=Streptomyces sp. G1 TaxID=361572 RepID=UPI00202DBDD5|nr:hypothetical protein [Streptomyces sp. G1]MCM1976485.1 hypothetical protein [Streptomyces sp. G1]
MNPLLPPIGAEIPCSVLAVGAFVEYDGAILPLDFKGGIKYRVEADPTDPFNSVRLRTVGFMVSAQGSNGMTFDIEQNDVADSSGRLTVVQPAPLKLKHRDVLSFTLTIQKSGAQAVVLTTRAPMVQLSTLTQFPPKGDTYTLESVVELINLENSNMRARLAVFDSKRSAL